MSIVILGMEMPKSCEDCPLVEETENFYGDTMSRVCNLIYKGYTSEAPKGGRLSNCPLLPLPEGHGRLIDADALIKEMFTASDGTIMRDTNIDGWSFEMRYKDIKRYIKNAPTIVPAEGGKGNV